jgi:hypothetical protein
MTAYNVEAITAPVRDGDFDKLRDAIDVIPGTILVEDPDEPTLILPVDADNPRSAHRLVDGLLKLAGVEPLKGRITKSDDADDDWAVLDQSEWRGLATP